MAEVRIIGDKADALQKVPGSGTLVTTKEIEREQPADVSEILRRVPGLTATAETGGGLRLDVGIHGLDPGRSRRVLILEDGVPVSVNPYSEPDIYYVPMAERMRGVEVVKGSGGGNASYTHRCQGEDGTETDRSPHGGEAPEAPGAADGS